jgi:CubicO group peptidase (beta-lactamase class C family)
VAIAAAPADIAARLRVVLGQRTHGIGAQLSARGPCGRCDLAMGDNPDGTPVSADSLYSVHCATKPMLTTALAVVVGDDRAFYERDVSQLLPRTSVFRSVSASVRDVLVHDAYLARPHLFEIHFQPTHGRSSLLSEALEFRAPGYSEYAGQALIGELLSVLSGQSADTCVRNMLDVIGISRDVRFGFSPEEFELEWQRLGIYALGLPNRQTPLLSDRIESQAAINRILLGAYANARGLARFYEAIGLVLEGSGQPGLPSRNALEALLAQRSDPRWDPVLKRTCSFAGGFMTNLSAFGFGAGVSPQACGHLGLLGASFGFYEPVSRVAGAVILNGLDGDGPSRDHARSYLVESMLQGSGGAT